MLETRNLTKIYKTKGGAAVKALDDVSIQFPEKGMVFLLGKSGSGKSTLLNVCGGLDAPTSGEIIVKGRSSKVFSQSDFDSYRNTYVGFIFQEYNILNEFTVEDNIALALELQGKKKDKKAIAQLLEQVDLTGYAKRKPNTLSGGQKQRIAIARALVKSPEIIMADEPTGALDSATGKQVFDTLKKLSKDKLVIVVSHDRDFAEYYGDRIIELKDGKVLSDVTKTLEQQQEISENVSVVGGTLCVKNGAELSEADFDEIKNFLSKADRDVIIASGERDVKTFKEVSHIRDNGEMEVFKDSEELPVEVKEYDPKDSRFIRSKLPARHAFKIGVSGLKHKKVRLFFTIMLCTIAFVFFGMLSTMTFYDNESTFKQSLKDSNYSLVKLGKIYNVTETWYMDGVEENDYSYSMSTRFTPDEMEEYAKKFGEDTFGAVSVWAEYSIQNHISQYWVSEIRNFAYLPEDNSLRERIQGRYPQKDDEICISSYSAEVMYNCKIYDPKTGDVVELKAPEDVIGKKVAFYNKTYTIVGIMDSGAVSDKYETLKDSESDNYLLYTGLYYELQDGLHLAAFVTENTFQQIAKENSFESGMDHFYEHNMSVTISTDGEGNYTFPDWPNAEYSGFSKNMTTAEMIALVEGAGMPADDEVVVSKQLFYELMMESYNKQLEKAASEGDSEAEARAAEILKWLRYLYEDCKIVENTVTGEDEYIGLTEEEATEYLNKVIDAIKQDGKTLTLATKLYDSYNGMPTGAVREFKIVGIWDVNRDYAGMRMLFSDEKAEELWSIQKQSLQYYSEYETNYVEPEGAIYDTLFVPYDHSDEVTNLLWSIYENKEFAADDSRTTLTTALISTLEMVDMMVVEMSKVFLYAGIILAVFAALLLSNFISISISYKKREIGILRAVGARSFDVFKIFFSESFVITAICVGLSIAGSLTCCALVNDMLVSVVGASLFVFGPESWAIVIAIALATAILATFLPVWNAARKKPVESIRAL